MEQKGMNCNNKEWPLLQQDKAQPHTQVQEQLKEHLTEYHYTSDNEVKIAVDEVPSSRYTILPHQTFGTT
jgi:hypothetical protein